MPSLPETIPQSVNLLIVQLLRNKCFKCASPDHMAFKCDVYGDKQHAFYLCSICQQGCHLPKDCKSKPTETVHLVDVEILSDKAVGTDLNL